MLWVEVLPGHLCRHGGLLLGDFCGLGMGLAHLETGGHSSLKKKIDSMVGDDFKSESNTAIWGVFFYVQVSS